MIVIAVTACALILFWAAKASSDSVARVGAVASVIASWPTVAVLGLVLLWEPINRLIRTIEAKVRAGTMELEFAGLKLSQIRAVQEAVSSAADAVSEAGSRAVPRGTTGSSTADHRPDDDDAEDESRVDAEDESPATDQDSARGALPGTKELPLFLDDARRREIERITPDGALLLVHAEVEELLRSLSRQVDLDTRTRLSTPRLARALAKEGLISSWHLDVIESSNAVRNALAHGARDSLDVLEGDLVSMTEYLTEVAIDVSGRLEVRRHA